MARLRHFFDYAHLCHVWSMGGMDVVGTAENRLEEKVSKKRNA